MVYKMLGVGSGRFTGQQWICDEENGDRSSAD